MNILRMSTKKKIELMYEVAIMLSCSDQETSVEIDSSFLFMVIILI